MRGGMATSKQSAPVFPKWDGGEGKQENEKRKRKKRFGEDAESDTKGKEEKDERTAFLWYGAWQRV